MALVDYRLAPEHPFPAAVEDAVSAVEYFRDAGEVVVGGDSAGANLALVSAQMNAAEVRALILLYPFLDLRLKWTAEQRAIHADERLGLKADRNAYLQGVDHADRRASPLLGAVPAVPALFVGIAEEDPLASDAVRLVDSVSSVDRIVVRTYPGTRHAFLLKDTPQPAVDAAVADITLMLQELADVDHL